MDIINLKKYLLFLSIFIVLVNPLFAQNLQVSKLYSENELNANTIYHITEDHAGFIWIGTNEGLFRFDGIEYKQYTVEDGLSDQDIFELKIDSANHIIIDNFSNELNYHYQGKFHNKFTDSILVDMQYNGNIIGRYLSADDAFIIGERDGDYFYYVKFKDGIICQKEKKLLPSGSEIFSILTLDSLSYVFYSIGKNTAYYNLYKNTELELPKQRLPYGGGDVVATKNAIFNIGLTGKSINRYQIEPNYRLKFEQSYTINYGIKNLFGHDNGLWITLAEGGAIQFDEGRIKQHLLPSKTVNSVFVDKFANIWVGTAADGIYFFEENNILNIGADALAVPPPISSLGVGLDGQVYIGYNKLVFALASAKDSFQYYPLVEHGEQRLRRIVKIQPYEKDKLLFGTDEGFQLVHFQQDTFIASKIFNRSIKDIAIDKEGCVWMGAGHGLILVQAKGNGLIETEIWGERITSLHLDKDNQLWIGTLNGIFIKKTQELSIQAYRTKGIDNKKINAIDSYANTLFIATDFGIFILDKLSQQYWNITKEAGLVSNQCRKVAYQSGYLWVTTRHGVNRFRLALDTRQVVEVQSYTTDEGLISNDVNDILYHKDTLWVATNEGLSLVPPDGIQPKKAKQTNIVWAKTDDKEYNIFEAISLAPDSNQISIGYSGMSMGPTNFDTYEYRLLPTRRDWSKINKSSITFYGLPPDTYTFEVRALTRTGAKVATPAHLSFEVEASFVQSTTFKLLLILIALSAAFFALRARDKAIKQKNSIGKTIALLELEAIKAQINPHFIYNSLNSIKNTILKKEVKHAEKQLSVFAKLVRMTLNISQKNFISLEEEITYLTQYLEMEKVRFKEDMDYDFIYESIPNLKQIQVPTMLIQPYVENAIKHGINPDKEEACHIQVRFYIKNKFLYIEIEDDGPGFRHTNKKSAIHRPQGMLISSTRSKTYKKLFGMDITIKATDKNKIDATQHGTIIQVTIPLRNYDTEKSSYH